MLTILKYLYAQSKINKTNIWHLQNNNNNNNNKFGVGNKKKYFRIRLRNIDMYLKFYL